MFIAAQRHLLHLTALACMLATPWIAGCASTPSLATAETQSSVCKVAAMKPGLATVNSAKAQERNDRLDDIAARAALARYLHSQPGANAGTLGQGGLAEALRECDRAAL
jgi:hypothetical protein